MQILKFKVSGQEIEQEEADRVVAGSEDYLYCRFTFDDSWGERDKAYRFFYENTAYSGLENEEGLVRVPTEVIRMPYFTIAVGGFCGSEFVPTVAARVEVEANGYGTKDSECEESKEVTKSLTAQIFEEVKKSKNSAETAAGAASDSKSSAETAEGYAEACVRSCSAAQNIAAGCLETAGTLTRGMQQLASDVDACEKKVEDLGTVLSYKGSVKSLPEVVSVVGTIIDDTVKAGDVYNVSENIDDIYTVCEMFDSPAYIVPYDLDPNSENFSKYLLSDGMSATLSKSFIMTHLSEFSDGIGDITLLNENGSEIYKIYVIEEITNQSIVFSPNGFNNVPSQVYGYRTQVRLKFSAGDNVAWTGVCWDKLSASANLSGYLTEAEAERRFLTEEDVSDFVKNTDIATSTTPGVVYVADNNTMSFGVEVTEDGFLQTKVASATKIFRKIDTFCPITPSCLDSAVRQSTHHKMSDDYDISSVTKSTTFTNYGDLPVSYDAVKEYIDDAVAALSARIDALSR